MNLRKSGGPVSFGQWRAFWELALVYENLGQRRRARSVRATLV
jgi:hypothetical protein